MKSKSKRKHLGESDSDDEDFHADHINSNGPASTEERGVRRSLRKRSVPRVFVTEQKKAYACWTIKEKDALLKFLESVNTRKVIYHTRYPYQIMRKRIRSKSVANVKTFMMTLERRGADAALVNMKKVPPIEGWRQIAEKLSCLANNDTPRLLMRLCNVMALESQDKVKDTPAKRTTNQKTSALTVLAKVDKTQTTRIGSVTPSVAFPVDACSSNDYRIAATLARAGGSASTKVVSSSAPPLCAAATFPKKSTAAGTKTEVAFPTTQTLSQEAAQVAASLPEEDTNNATIAFKEAGGRPRVVRPVFQTSASLFQESTRETVGLAAAADTWGNTWSKHTAPEAAAPADQLLTPDIASESTFTGAISRMNNDTRVPSKAGQTPELTLPPDQTFTPVPGDATPSTSNSMAGVTDSVTTRHTGPPRDPLTNLTRAALLTGSGRKDSSVKTGLTTLLDKLKPHLDLKPDYAAIYKYMGNLMVGTQKRLPPLESCIVLDLLSTVEEHLKGRNNQEQKQFIQGRVLDIMRKLYMSIEKKNSPHIVMDENDTTGHVISEEVDPSHARLHQASQSEQTVHQTSQSDDGTVNLHNGNETFDQSEGTMSPGGQSASETGVAKKPRYDGLKSLNQLNIPARLMEIRKGN